ncbi:uncharacterized protein HaLaN_11737, partial [Haematococcus lacustris]
MRQQPKLLYAVVARGTVTLAEHSNVAGNANLIAVRILEKLGPEDTRVSYSQERHMFHVLVQDGLTCMVMAEESSGRRIPFAFLDDIRARFYASYGNAREALAYEYSTDFGPVLAERMAFFGNDPAADTITRVKGELLEVKNIMIENIEKVLERGEKLDLLVDKTDNLQGPLEQHKAGGQASRRGGAGWALPGGGRTPPWAAVVAVAAKDGKMGCGQMIMGCISTSLTPCAARGVAQG